MFVVAVYVTSRYADYVEFSAAMDEALKKYIPTGKPNAICTGSSKGNEKGNALVRRYAFEKGIPCRVFETQWANHIPTKPGKKNTAGVRANAMIIRSSNAAIMFWSPTAIKKWDYMSGGCYNFQKMCGKMGRELIPIKVDIYKPLTKAPEEEEIHGSPNRESNVGEIGGRIPMGGDMPPVGADIPSGGPSFGGTSLPHLGGGGGSVPPPDVGAVPPPDVSGNMGDDMGEIPMPSSESPSIEPIRLPGNGSRISEVPIDLNADGITDTSISAMDTTGDGVPDSQLTPVDIDNNGTVDRVDLTPLPPVSTPPQQPTPMPSTPDAPQPTPTEEENQTPVQ